MDVREQNNYNVFRRDVYRVAVSNESQETRRIVRSVDDDDDENLEDENLEALRLAALMTMRPKSSYARGGFNTTNVGGTRRVSLGWEDKSDLQIVTLERQDSFSSSSTDYEEIDLSTPPADKRTFPDSEDSDTDFDHDNYVNIEDKYDSDSQKEEQSLDTAFAYEEEEEKEMTEDGAEVYDNSDDDDENDVFGDNEMFDYYEDNHHDGENISDDIDNAGANEALSDDEALGNENGQQADEDNVEQENDEDILEDIDKNSTNDLEDETFDSDNEINILNDISITIANESLTNVPVNSTSKDILNGSGQENDLSSFQYSNGEQLDDTNVISSPRIIISRLDSKDENDSDVKEEIKQPKEQHAITSKKCAVDKVEKMDSHETSVPAASETSKAVLSSGKVDFSFAKVDLSSAEVDSSLERKQSHAVQKIKKDPDSNVKASPNNVKTNSQSSTVETVKPKVKGTLTSKSNEDVKQEVLPMENAGNKTKEIGNDKEKAQKVNKISLVKGDNNANKIAGISKPERLDLNEKNEDRDEMDFDQLSIEDEDSDFIEEEENLPAVKSKVGLNKIPSERLRTKRNSTRENDRKRRRSYSPERSRISSRSDQSHSLSRDRLRDQHLRDRSRERFRGRSQSPVLKNRTYRRNYYSRHERSRSRDRTHNRIASDGKNREHRRYRSRSRSGSRLKSGRTDEKNLKSNVNKQIKKNSVKVSEKEPLETKTKKDEGASMKSQQRKNIVVQKNSDKKVSAKITESKSSKSVLPASNSGKVKSKPSAVQVETKQPKDLRTRLTVKNVGQDTNTSSKKSVEKDSTELVRERELDERIQRIKQQNEAILKRAKEIHAEKLKFR